MKCFQPLRIKNPYNDKFLHVPCRNCEACLVSSANIKSQELKTTIRQYQYNYLITLTYDNDNVPYIVPGMPYVFRGQSDSIEILGDVIEPINLENFHNPILTNHDVDNSVGVLWYDDVQRFFKRFRKYILKNYGVREIKYFCLGEYGSTYGRPHFHIVIMSSNLLYEEMFGAVVNNWKMHDWNRFWKNGVFEAIKRCDSGTAYYVSSYICSLVGSFSISSYKQFRQKTCRSKNLYFGLDASLYEDYKEDVIRLSNGILFEGNRQVFYYWDCSQKDNITLRLLPKKYVDTFFHKFKEYNQVSYVDKLSRAYHIVKVCRECECRKISKSKVEHLFSDDLSFYRAYKRFIDVFGYFTVLDYLVLMEKVLNYFSSQIIRQQMMEYEQLSHNDYVLKQIDTCIERPKDRLIELRLKYRVSIPDLYLVNLDCPPVERNMLDDYVHKYKKRLLPKHFNDKSNFLNLV